MTTYTMLKMITGQIVLFIQQDMNIAGTTTVSIAITFNIIITNCSSREYLLLKYTYPSREKETTIKMKYNNMNI